MRGATDCMNDRRQRRRRVRGPKAVGRDRPSRRVVGLTSCSVDKSTHPEDTHLRTHTWGRTPEAPENISLSHSLLCTGTHSSLHSWPETLQSPFRHDRWVKPGELATEITGSLPHTRATHRHGVGSYNHKLCRHLSWCLVCVRHHLVCVCCVLQASSTVSSNKPVVF